MVLFCRFLLRIVNLLVSGRGALRGTTDGETAGSTTIGSGI